MTNGDQHPEDEFHDQDWFLRFLVRLVNLSDTSLSITLTVGGTLVSGELVGGRTYFMGVKRSFLSAMRKGMTPDESVANETLQMFDDYFDSVISIYPESFEDREEEHEEAEREVVFLHMTNVRFFQPGGEPIPTPPGEGVSWRGRISRVDGFSLGSMQVTS